MASQAIFSGAATNYGALTINAGAQLSVLNGKAFTQAAGATVVNGSLVASAIVASGGLLDFASAITAGNGVGALAIGAKGALEFGAAVDNSHSVAFQAATGELELGSLSTFAGSVSGFGGGDIIDLLSTPATGLSYAGNSTSGVLSVLGASGTIGKIAFQGGYHSSSFDLVSDGHGGTEIVAATGAPDVWNGSGDWNSNSSDWSAGVPGSTTIAEIHSGVCALSTTGAAALLTVDSGQRLELTGASTLSVKDWLDNAGILDVNAASYSDGGATATVVGILDNTGSLNIGNFYLSNPAALAVGGLVNSGSVVLQGNTTASSALNQASLVIGGAAPTIATGSLRVSGDALVEYTSGGIGQIAAGAWLELDGSQARITTGGTATSALGQLGANSGVLMLRGDTGLGAGGAVFGTAVGFANSGTLYIDSYQWNDGGSSANFGGNLVNYGSLSIGNNFLAAATVVQAKSFANYGSFVLQGQAAAAATNQASLVVAGAAASSIYGYQRVSGDALLEFGSGYIGSIGDSGWLELDGAQSRITTGGTTTSALAQLSSNLGTLMLRGDVNLGAGGVSLTTTTGFANSGTVYIDSYQWNDGGSSASFGGNLMNYGSLSIGNFFLSAATVVQAKGFANYGSFVLQGQAASSATNQASLIVAGAAESTIYGYQRVSGDALLEFGSGYVTSIAYGGWLELDGAQSRITTGGTTTSALAQLATNSGTLTLRGDVHLGAGGVSLTTTTGFTNSGTVYIDSYQWNDGGTSVSFGGNLTNYASLSIGNLLLPAATVVQAKNFANYGTFVLQGQAASSATNQASLIVAGAAESTIYGYQRVSGDALLEFGSGYVTSIAYGGWLELDGAQSRITTGGTTTSALAQLNTNSGTLMLRGDVNLGAGGVSLTTTKGFANSGTVYIDSYQWNDGGTSANFGGNLMNYGSLSIGNFFLSAATVVQAKTFANSGSFVLQGHQSASGAANQASLIVAGAAESTIYGSQRVSGDALLEFGSGYVTSVAHGGGFEIDGAAARVTTGGTSVSALGGLASNYGALTLRGDTALGAGGAGVATTGPFANYGLLNVDSTAWNDGGSTFTVGGGLSNYGTLNVGNTMLSAATTINAASFANYGSMSLYSGNGRLAELVVNGAASDSGYLTINSGTEIDVTGAYAFTQAGGETVVHGSLVAPTIVANGGVLDFATAVTSGDGVGALNIGAKGDLQFDAAVDSSHSVTFQASTGSLVLGDAAHFAASIHGFAASDAIDLLGAPVTALGYASGILTVSGSSGTLATLAFSGSYTNSSFKFTSDGHAGSLIVLS